MINSGVRTVRKAITLFFFIFILFAYFKNDRSKCFKCYKCRKDWEQPRTTRYIYMKYGFISIAFLVKFMWSFLIGKPGIFGA